MRTMRRKVRNIRRNFEKENWDKERTKRGEKGGKCERKSVRNMR